MTMSKFRHLYAIHVIAIAFGHDCYIQNVVSGGRKIIHSEEKKNHNLGRSRCRSSIFVHGEDITPKRASYRRQQRILQSRRLQQTGDVGRQQIQWIFQPHPSQQAVVVPDQTSSSQVAIPNQASVVQHPIPTSQPSRAPSQSPSKSPLTSASQESHEENVNDIATQQVVGERNQISALYQQPDYSAYYVPVEDTTTNSEPLFESGQGQVTVQVTAENDATASNGSDVQANNPDEMDEDKDLEDTSTDGSSVKGTSSVPQGYEEENVVVEIEASSLVTLNTFRIAYAPTEKDGLQTNREAVFITTAALTNFLNDRFDGVEFEVYATGGIDFVSDNAVRRLQKEESTGTTYISYGSRATGFNLNPTDIESRIYDLLHSESMALVAEIKQQLNEGNCANDKRCAEFLDQVRWVNYEKSAPVDLAGESSLRDTIGTLSDSSSEDNKTASSTSMIIGIVASLACLGVVVAFFIRRKMVKDHIETESVVSNSHLTSAAVGTDATVVSASSGISMCVRFPMGRMNSSQCKTKGPGMAKSRGLTAKPTPITGSEADAASAISSDATTRSAVTVKSKSLRNCRAKKAKPKGGRGLFNARKQCLGDDLDCDALTTIQEGDCETSTVNPDDESHIMKERVAAPTRFTSDFAIEEEDESSDSDENEDNDASTSKPASFGSHGLLDWFRQTPNKKQNKKAVEHVLPKSITESERYKVIDIKAPPGKLGLTVIAPDSERALDEPFSEWCTVESVQEVSPLFGRAKPGDFLVRIDKHNLSGWTPMQISDYIGGKAKEERNLIFCRDLSTTSQSEGTKRDGISQNADEENSDKPLTLPSSLRVTSDGDSQDSGAGNACLQLDLNNVIGTFTHI